MFCYKRVVFRSLLSLQLCKWLATLCVFSKTSRKKTHYFTDYKQNWNGLLALRYKQQLNQGDILKPKNIVIHVRQMPNNTKITRSLKRTSMIHIQHKLNTTKAQLPGNIQRSTSYLLAGPEISPYRENTRLQKQFVLQLEFFIASDAGYVQEMSTRISLLVAYLMSSTN